MSHVRPYILLAILLGLRIPNLALPVPIISSSYALLRITSIILVASLLLFPAGTHIRFTRPLLILIVSYFLFASLSVIHAQNISSFLNMYKDIVFSLLLFFCVYLTISVDNIDQISKGLMIFTIVLIGIEILFYLFPTLLLPVLNSIFNENYLKFFLYQYNRGRYFGDSLNEAMIPLVLTIALNKRRWGNNAVFFILISLGVSFTVFVSNWRTKAIIFLFSFSSTIFFLTKKRALHVLLTIGFIFFFLAGVLKVVTVFNGTGSVIDRFIEDGVDQYGSNSNTARINYWQDAVNIGNSHVLTGVGLGNYFDSLSQQSKFNNLSASFGRQFILIDDPHNLFFSAYASTGLLGLISLIALICYFAVTDIQHLKRSRNHYLTSYSLIFWSIFIYSLFNPWLYYQYLGQFWLLRGIIEKLKYIHD